MQNDLGFPKYRKPGRPKGTDEKKRIYIYLGPAELERLKKNAECLQLSMSTFIRLNLNHLLSKPNQ